MRRILIITGVMLIPLAVPVFSGDLCLIDIDSQSQLIMVENCIDHARGTIDGRFITVVSENQLDNLVRNSIPVEIIERNCRLDNLYMIVEKKGRQLATVIDYNPIYSAEGIHLAHLEKSSIDILFREGLISVSLVERATPFYFNPPTVPGIIREAYPTDTLADLINQDSLYSYDIRLAAFQTRFLASDSVIAARDWLKAKFRSFGYTDVYHDEFIVNKPEWGIEDVLNNNVICIKEGSEMPDRYILVGAHYDSYNRDSDPMYYAPGADDDASGVACVLEAARILWNFDNKRSIMFVPFGGEEYGMFGSTHLAQTLYDDNVDLEVVINLDMVGFIADTIPDLDVWSDNNRAYRKLFEAAMARVSYLVLPGSGSPRTDDVPFGDYGFNTVGVSEHDFPDNWTYHSDFDLPEYMDFNYLEQVARVFIAAIAHFDQAPEPIVCQVADGGDGQMMRVFWEDCSVDCAYKVVYGTSASQLTDTLDVPRPECHHDITGLSEDQTYYFGVLAIPDDDVPQIIVLLTEAVPQVIPRPPEELTATPDTAEVTLTWRANTELDISHYRIYRKSLTSGWELIIDNHTDNLFVDDGIEPHKVYMYYVTAVDSDGHESEASSYAQTALVTLDLGILFIDETQSGGINPTESAQLEFYNSILDTFAYDLHKIDSADEALNRYIAGQYNPLFWVDDDDYNHVWEGSIDSIQWYFNYGPDFLLAGWESITSITGQTYFYNGDFFHDQLGLSYVGQCVITDFIGATGEGDWPDLELKANAPNYARLDNIQIFLPAAGAEVILRFNSYSGNPFYNDKPVGVIYDTYNGKRVVLGFPLYWLTEESARGLLARVMQYFAAPSQYVYGDVNEDRIVNLLDITYLIAYLYQGGPPPVRVNHGDPNGDCTINILDVSYLISFLYLSGPAPVEGCVE